MDELLRRDAPYLKVLEADDTDLDALTQLGTVLYTNGQLAAGRRALLRAAEFHPSDPLARINVGNILLDQDDLTGARAEFESALALDPASVRAQRGLGIVAARCQDDVALRDLARVLRTISPPE